MIFRSHPKNRNKIILGIFFFNIFSISSNIVEGREFIKKNILQLAIVLLGIKISLTQLWRVSIESIFVIIITILSIFLTYFFIKKFWPTQKGISKLLAIGTSICGVTAIMASSTILKSKDQDYHIVDIQRVVLFDLSILKKDETQIEKLLTSDIIQGLEISLDEIKEKDMIYTDVELKESLIASFIEI